MNRDLVLAAVTACALHVGALAGIAFSSRPHVVFARGETRTTVTMASVPTTPERREVEPPMLEPVERALPAAHSFAPPRYISQPNAVVTGVSPTGPRERPLINDQTPRTVDPSPLPAPNAVTPGPAFPPVARIDDSALPGLPAPEPVEAVVSDHSSEPSGGSTDRPRIVSTRKPVYPTLAKRRGQEGIVELRVQVRPSGECGDVTVIKSSGHELLDRAAVRAVRTWRFEPAVRGGRVVTSWLEVPVEFSIES